MTDNPKPEASKVLGSSAGMRAEIQQKWGRFNAEETYRSARARRDVCCSVSFCSELTRRFQHP